MLTLFLCLAVAPPVNEARVVGKVKSLDAATGVVVIQRDSGKETRVKVDAKTELRTDGKLCKWSDFRAGDDCVCVFNLNTGVALALGRFVQIDRPRE